MLEYIMYRCSAVHALNYVLPRNIGASNSLQNDHMGHGCYHLSALDKHFAALVKEQH